MNIRILNEDKSMLNKFFNAVMFGDLSKIQKIYSQLHSLKDAIGTIQPSFPSFNLDATVLMIASYNGEMDKVKWLIEKVPTVLYNLNCKNSKGFDALMYATLKGHTEAVKYLLEKGANPIQSEEGRISARSIATKIAQREDLSRDEKEKFSAIAGLLEKAEVETRNKQNLEKPVKKPLLLARKIGLINRIYRTCPCLKRKPITAQAGVKDEFGGM